nr:MAG TPA: hypothetical protein [Caudoviricetes sp.]
MENVFDLQRFAEAEAAPEAAAPEAAPEEAPEAPKEEIPAELAGISEDSARETMAQAKAQAAKEAPAEDAADGAAEEAAEDAAGLTGQKIPYVRFKQEHDRKKELEAQLKDLSSEVERLRAQQAPPQPQQAMQQAPQVQQPRITPEATKQLNAIVRQQALQLTGFSKEDVDALSYMDDDPRREQWKTAVDVARTQVIDGVYKMQQQRAAQAQQFMALHNAAVADYNAFAQKEMSDPAYPQVMQYAINDYFEKGISKAEQPAIAAAYQRIEHNVASPGDIALIKRYFLDAKASFSGKKSRQAQGGRVMEKVQQAESFPRSEKVAGAADVGGNVSAATLDKMLSEKNWEDIPARYRQMLLSGQLS